MSKNWVNDIANMHTHYGLNGPVRMMDKEKLRAFLDFRIKFLQEELDELKDSDNAEDTIDALIDLCVVAIGTLDAFAADAYKAWDKVLEANMAKKVGVKDGRPNPLNLPDLYKPPEWRAPDHSGDNSMFDHVYKK